MSHRLAHPTEVRAPARVYARWGPNLQCTETAKSYCSVIQATARSGPAGPNELPATSPASLIALATLDALPGSGSRRSTLKEPDPVGDQTAPCVSAVWLADNPATRPFESMALAKPRVSPGRVPRSVRLYDPEPVGVQTAARSTVPSAEAASAAI